MSRLTVSIILTRRSTHERSLKTHGGKSYLAQRIVQLMPPHTHFVEPFAGGLAVLLAKPCEGISEVVNDLDGNFTTFWQVLQDARMFARFKRRVEVIPFSEVEWQKAKEYLDNLPDPAKQTELG